MKHPYEIGTLCWLRKPRRLNEKYGHIFAIVKWHDDRETSSGYAYTIKSIATGEVLGFSWALSEDLWEMLPEAGEENETTETQA